MAPVFWALHVEDSLLRLRPEHKERKVSLVPQGADSRLCFPRAIRALSLISLPLWDSRVFLLLSYLFSVLSTGPLIVRLAD